MSSQTYEVIAESNGHKWVEYTFPRRANKLICCGDCGVVRRSDDQNKPCRGKVRVEPRSVRYGARAYPL